MAINPVEIIIRAKDEASGIFSSMGSKVAAVGASIAAYFGVNAFIGAVKGAADLEAKLSEVAAVSGATAAEMVQLRQAAEAAGASTKFTATEAADALGNLSRAGLSAKDAITALPAVLQLAQAGGVELGAASEYVTKTIMGLGLAFTDAGRVADVLALGANASNTSVNGLAQALSYAAPLANTLGLSLETTVAIIGKFADAGIDASRAGTALNAIMAQFADPASKFRAELSNAGITTTNFEQALRQLAAAGPAGSKAINAVGTEAGPALRALLNQGIGALDDLKGKLDNAAGSAAKTAAVMEGNLNGAMKGMSSAWDTVKNALTTPVLPVLTQGMNDLAAAFRGMVNGGTVARFGAAITTAFEGAIKWVKAFAAEADFGALATRMQAFATDTQATFTKLGEYATNAGNMVKTAYGVMSAGVDAVLVVVYGLGEAFSGVASNIQSGLALLLQGLAKITFGGVSESFKQAAAEVKLSAEATWAASEAFAAKGQKAFEGMAAGAETA
ncbi:MAG: phage tail tape measure protein, partial [Comamonadaceae bacterium CG_4_9_14_0_8_um_filter_57_21]